MQLGYCRKRLSKKSDPSLSTNPGFHADIRCRHINQNIFKVIIIVLRAIFQPYNLIFLHAATLSSSFLAWRENISYTLWFPFSFLGFRECCLHECSQKYRLFFVANRVLPTNGIKVSLERVIYIDNPLYSFNSAHNLRPMARTISFLLCVCSNGSGVFTAVSGINNNGS